MQGSGSMCASSHRMFLNVGFDLTEKQVRVFFDSFGQVTDVYLPKQANGRNKGFGFATFRDAEALQAALKVSAHTIGDFTVQVKRAGPRPSEPDVSGRKAGPALDNKPRCAEQSSRKLYVSGVADAVRVPTLRRHFGAWGKVVDVTLCGKNAGKHTKNCFITFDNPLSAGRAHEESPRRLDGWPLGCISVVTEGIKATSPPGSAIIADADCVSKAAEEALVSNLQAQILAHGCSDLQQYARYLKLLASGATSETPTPALTRLKRLNHAESVQTASSHPCHPPRFLFQTHFCPPAVSNSPVQNANSLWSAVQPSNFPPQVSAQAAVFPGMHTEYYPPSVQSAPAETLPLVSGIPTFPAWSESLASSESACSTTFPNSEAISHHFPACTSAELELQTHLAQLCQSAVGAVYQRHAESPGYDFQDHGVASGWGML